MFAYLNWNKQGVVLDLASPSGREGLAGLVSQCHIVIESFRPDEALELGLSPKWMLGHNPRVVVASVTDFGRTGPYAGFFGSDLVLQAMSGIMQISGDVMRAPLKHGLNQAAFCAGLNTAYAALAAFTAAERDGIGEHVDVSALECLVSELVTCETYYTFMGAIQGRRMAVQDPYSGAPIPTRKGYFSFQASLAVPNETFADLFRDEAFRDPQFASNRQRSQHVPAVRERVEHAVKDRDAKALFIDGSQRRLLMGIVQTAPDLLECEQLAERGFWADVAHPGGTTWRYPGELAKMSFTPTTVRQRAPALGEHTQDVLGRWIRPQSPASSNSASDARPPAVAGAFRAQARLPLEGLRVLDLATVIAVPYMAGLMSDLGAEVIKIESPHKLDPTRQGVLTTYLDNDTREDGINRSGMFNVVNRGKLSMALDMSQAEGREVFRALVAKSDIVVNNFTPRVMSNWGMDDTQLRSLNPRLICLSNTGYGGTGPWRNFPSQGTTLEVTMGIAAYTGYRGDPPWKVGQSYPDFLACWTGLAAILAALHHVRRTGQGQSIDLGMYQVGVAMIPEALLAWQLDGSAPQRIGNEHEHHVPSNVYPCAGHDRWIALTVQTDVQWQALAATLAADGFIADPSWSDEGTRRVQRVAVDAWIARWAHARDGFELLRRLQATGIACGPVMNNRDILLNAHLGARGFHERVHMQPPMGTRPIMGRPWRFAHRDVRIRKPAPRYGADGPAILRDVLGMGEAQIQSLQNSYVVCHAPRSPKPFDAMGLTELQRLKAIHEVDPAYREKLGIVSADGPLA